MKRVRELKGNIVSSPHSAPLQGLLMGGSYTGSFSQRGACHQALQALLVLGPHQRRVILLPWLYGMVAAHGGLPLLPLDT